jgi:glutamine amidotransferase
MDDSQHGAVHRRREAAMCRWMAYAGDPILAEELLYRPAHSIIDQSLHAKLGGFTTNGDGFGIGWYGERAEPSVYKSTHPGRSRSSPRSSAI